MFFLFKKIIFTLTFNSSLFLLLLVGIQNSAQRSRVNLLINETVKLPISFTVGVSFLTGSLLGSILTTNNNPKK